MKSAPFVLLTYFSAVALSHSQGESSALFPERTTVPVAPGVAQILGKIPDGTPPQPSKPKPKYTVAQDDVLQTDSHQQGGRTITIQQIKPIDLPPPPQPGQASAEVSEEFSLRLAEYREKHPRSNMMFIGATVFRSKNSPPRTLMRLWPQGGGAAIELWSSVDMALIAGGISHFQDSAGNRHQLMIAWSNLDSERLSEILAAKGREYTPPKIPDFPEGNAIFQVAGDRKPAPEVLVAIQSLHDLYNQERPRLLTALEGRERARIQREAYLKAHPPQPEDITLNYWRTEKPVAAGRKGGAQ